MKSPSDTGLAGPHRFHAAVLFAVILLGAWPAAVLAAPTRNIGFFVGDSDAYTAYHALEHLDVPGLSVRVFTEVDTGTPEMAAFLARMDIAVVDIMQSQPADWLLENRSRIGPKATLYAVRGSSHTQDFLDAGFLMDRTVWTYFAHTSAANLTQMIRFLAHRDLGMEVSADPPVTPPDNALYHPDAPRLFADLAEYVAWYQESGHFRETGLWDLTAIFPTYTIDGKKDAVDALIRAYEQRGINVVAWMREMKDWDKAMVRLLSTPPLSERLGSITGYVFKFSSGLSADMAGALERANVPVLNAQYLFFTPKEDWLASPQGISPTELTHQFGTPELSALVEPTVIGVKEPVPELGDAGEGRTGPGKVRAFRYVPVESQVDLLARRAARWHALKRKPNRDKKILLMYYNHGAGKQNIGASYLNVFRSITRIIERLRAEGYAIEGELTEDMVQDLLLKSGRNVGSWAPDELDRLLAERNAIRVDMAEYRTWFGETPAAFRAGVEKDWGNPETGNIMVKDGKFILPGVRLGNLLLAPQPVRGFDDPEKLYHSTVLYPHHQYNAFYFWLQRKFRPDAMVSLGTHGTHEWLPGKQTGLTVDCPPEVLIGEIPNLYPYIVDDVGEGIQAKRRGRGVVIDHAVPPFKAGGVYEEYATLTALIGEYEASSSEPVRAARLERIREMTIRLGLDKDLGLASVDADALERIGHYLVELKTGMIPYGLHTFGVSASDEALTETARAMAERGGDTAENYADRIRACGPSEMDALVRGLSGGYIPPASGNDPIRNPESLPTGKNFYAFDPDKVPSREAWEAGKKAGDEILAAYGAKHDGAWPEQVGVILWSVETIRDEGINVATALWLMGMTPVWDRRDKVTDVVPIPGPKLNRPRVDVLLQMSGLFRDTFPAVALMLDKAVKKAATLTDIDNFLRKHSQAVEAALVARGSSPDEARRLSLVRLFSAPPGAYGTKVDDLAGASGMWEDDDVVADNGFIRMQSHGYSAEEWGKPMEETYRAHLESVDATVHTISSNLYGTMDNDDMFQYLGGLSMAVRKVSGKDPEVFVSMQRTLGQGHVEPLSATLGREARSRYFNPKWIEGMKGEGYAGAREMAEFMENMWGWQVTAPASVDKSLWEQSFEVYVEDKYGQDLKEFFNKTNPWAYQSMTARMLEAVRKGYWKAGDKVTQKLAAEYALNVVEKGVACCDHTCNNPLLNEMVVNIVSLPGVLAPEIVDQFKMAVERAAKTPLDQQVQERRELLERLRPSQKPPRDQPPRERPDRKADQRQPDKPADPKADSATENPDTVKGYKMEDMDQKDDSTELTSSGVQWFAALFVLLLVALFVWGSRRKRK